MNLKTSSFVLHLAISEHSLLRSVGVTFDPLFETDRSDCAAALIQSGVTALLQGQETTLKFNKQ